MKIHRRLQETDDPREYAVLVQLMRCYDDGESYTKDWKYAVCSCSNHRRSWTKKKSKMIRRSYENRRSWKFYRKTQYKCIDYNTGEN